LRAIKRIIAFALIAIVLLFVAPTARAVEGTTLPDSFLIGDSTGLVDNSGAYFLYAEQVMPDSVITRTLTMQNLELNSEFKLYLYVESVEQSGPLNLLDNMFLSISQDGKVLYKGRLRGDGTGTSSYAGNGVNFAQNSLFLGTFKSGDQSALTAEVKMDSALLTNEDWLTPSSAIAQWTFVAVKDTPEEVTPPKTGEVLQYTMYVVLLMLLISIVMLMYMRKKLKDDLRRR